MAIAGCCEQPSSAHYSRLSRLRQVACVIRASTHEQTGIVADGHSGLPRLRSLPMAHYNDHAVQPGIGGLSTASTACWRHSVPGIAQRLAGVAHATSLACRLRRLRQMAAAATHMGERRYDGISGPPATAPRPVSQTRRMSIPGRPAGGPPRRRWQWLGPSTPTHVADGRGRRCGRQATEGTGTAPRGCRPHEITFQVPPWNATRRCL